MTSEKREIINQLSIATQAVQNIAVGYYKRAGEISLIVDISDTNFVTLLKVTNSCAVHTESRQGDDVCIFLFPDGMTLGEFKEDVHNFMDWCRENKLFK